MKTTRLIVIGGFLGSGKTTLLARAAVELTQRGLKVGLVTNDQAANLVDTQLLREHGFTVGEVAGGCFCCKFDSLVANLDKLGADISPDVIISEPVGSCTDLAATIFQPLKQFYPERFELAPLTVLVDPFRLRHILRGDLSAPFPESIFYIFEKQMEEADMLVLNKVDSFPPKQLDMIEAKLAGRFPGKPILRMSVRRGDGIAGWLDRIQHECYRSAHGIEMNYDTYAEGEAQLGWLNAVIQLKALDPRADITTFSRSLLEQLRKRLAERTVPAEIGHIKLSASTPRGRVQANLTSINGEVSLESIGKRVSSAPSASMTLNARANLAPEHLEQLVCEAVSQLAAESHFLAEITELEAFSPARPQPVHRLNGFAHQQD